MGARVVTDQQGGFASGWNPVSDPAFVRPDQAAQMGNFRLSSYGAALKRLGSALVSPSALSTFNATQVSGIQWPNDSNRIYVVGAATDGVGTHLFRTSYSFPNPATWTDLGAILRVRPVLFNDGTNEVLYFASGGGAIQKCDGTTISTPAGASGVDGICVYNDRLWGWKSNVLYYSNLSSAIGSTGGDSLGNTGAGGGSIVVRTFGATNIKACAAVNGNLLIFHEQGISVLTGWGQDDIQVQPQVLNASIGLGPLGSLDYLTVANEISTGDIAYFLTPFGVYMTNGGFVRPLATPDKPDPIAGRWTVTGGLTDPNNFVAFSPGPNEVWVFINNLGIYVYNVVLAAWSGPFTGPWTTQNGSARTPFFFPVNRGGTNAKPFLWSVLVDRGLQGCSVLECDSFMGGSTPLYKDSVTPDGTTSGTGGTAVTATLQMHRFFAGDRMFSKSWRWCNLLASVPSGTGGAIQAIYQPQLIGAGTSTTNALVAAEAPYYIPIGGTGNYIDITVVDAVSTGQTQYAMATVQGNFLGQR